MTDQPAPKGRPRRPRLPRIERRTLYTLQELRDHHAELLTRAESRAIYHAGQVAALDAALERLDR